MSLTHRSATFSRINVDNFDISRDDQGMETQYQPVFEEPKDQTPHSCDIRADDSGIWNACKAWYLVFIHLAACVIFLLCIEKLVDDQDFRTGSPPSVFALPLYQAQVTGLISFSLLIIRTLGGACFTLLLWRTIFVTLDREGVTLVELVRLNNYGVPMLPRWSSKSRLVWSIWAALVIILSRPSGFASPLANSAVIWIPSTQLSSNSITIPTEVVDESTDWSFLDYSELRLKTLVTAASMAGKDPAYAFISKRTPLRRYFSSVQAISTNSVINITAPYFDIDLQWIDGADKTRFQHVGDSNYADIASSDINTRSNGSVEILRNETWDVTKAIPHASAVFSREEIISIKVNTLNANATLPDGTVVYKDMPCPTTSLSLGKLPNITQHERHFVEGNTTKWLGKDCFLIAEASITAGKYNGTNCSVDPTNKDAYAATCTMQTSHDEVEADWLSSVSIDFMSETMKYIVMLDFTSTWMFDNVEGYTTGMLHLAHHAAWSSLTKNMGTHSESATATPAESVIRARVDGTKMSIWFGMCSALTLSAILVAAGLRFSSMKTVRDPALAALSVDLSDVAHSGHESGLCNAVALSKEDRKLPRLKFANDCNGNESDKCRRRLVFA